MTLITEIVISLLLVAGTVLVALGMMGLVRFPDTYNRIHAGGVASTLGTTLILIAGTVYFSAIHEFTLKLLLVIPFLFWTASAGAFMTGRAAHRTGPELAPVTIRDDLSRDAGVAREHE